MELKALKKQKLFLQETSIEYPSNNFEKKRFNHGSSEKKVDSSLYTVENSKTYTINYLAE